MQRTLAVLTIAALAATPLAAEAASKKPPPKPTKRVVTWDYTGVFGAYASAAGGGGSCTANPGACFDLTTHKHETAVAFKAADLTGQKIAVQYSIDGDYDNNVVSCSGGTVQVAKGSVVNFFVVASPDCPGVATQGKVTLTVTGKK